MPNKWQFKTEIKTSSIHGHGRFTMEDISAGKRVLILKGNIVSKEEAPRKFPINDTHNLDCDDTYVNHSEDPNLILVKTTTTIIVERTFIAKKSIKKGTELTMNYKEFAGDRKFLF